MIIKWGPASEEELAARKPAAPAKPVKVKKPSKAKSED